MTSLDGPEAISPAVANELIEISNDSGTDFLRDEDFYFNSVVFRAGKTHFKVPVYALPTEEGVFSAMFELPNKAGEGSSDRNPIRLPPEVTAFEFRSFLKAIVPMPENIEMPKLTVHEWMSVLKLATMWCLDDLRVKAIGCADKEVSTLTTSGEDGFISKVLLGKRYRVSRWLIEGYEGLAKRDAYLSAFERSQLGVDTAFRIFELREKSWAWAHKRRPVEIPKSWADNPFPKPGSISHPAYLAQLSVYKERGKFDYLPSIRYIFDNELRLDPSYNPSGESRGTAPQPIKKKQMQWKRR